jgi:hypothetical protein
MQEYQGDVDKINPIDYEELHEISDKQVSVLSMPVSFEGILCCIHF